MELRKLAMLVSLLLLAAIASARAGEAAAGWGTGLTYGRCFHGDSCTWDRELLHFVLHPGDVRAEAQDPLHVPYGQTTRYHLTFRVPESFRLTNDSDQMVIAQVHADNDQSPPVALRLRGHDLAVTIRHRTEPGSSGQGDEVVPYRAPLRFGEWHEAELSIRAGASGFLAVNLDGDRIVTYEGPLGYLGKANYVKIGLYDFSNTSREDCEVDYAWFRRDP